MKKVLVGMLALVMCLGMVSCSKESAAPNLKDVVEKAKTEGANWSVDEWKAAMKDVMLAVKPMMLEVQDIMKSMEGAEGEEADGAKVVEAMAKLADIQKKYPDYENLMNEFEEAAKSTENGKKVIDDDAYAKELAKELGLPEDM